MYLKKNIMRRYLLNNKNSDQQRKEKKGKNRYHKM